MLDRKLRLWNPHRLDKPIASLRGHGSPLSAIEVNDRNGLVLSLDLAKTFRIWDIRLQTCIKAIVNSVRQFPDDVLSFILFQHDSLGDSVITASKTVHHYRFPESFQSHSDDLKVVF